MPPFLQPSTPAVFALADGCVLRGPAVAERVPVRGEAVEGTGLYLDEDV